MFSHYIIFNNMNKFAKTTAYGVRIAAPLICRKKWPWDVVKLHLSTIMTALVIRSPLLFGIEGYRNCTPAVILMVREFSFILFMSEIRCNGLRS